MDTEIVVGPWLNNISRRSYYRQGKQLSYRTPNITELKSPITAVHDRSAYALKVT